MHIFPILVFIILSVSDSWWHIEQGVNELYRFNSTWLNFV